MANANQWCVPDEVHDALGVDFDRSLSSIDVDLETPPNTMNTTVFAVPDISSRKDDKNCSTPGGGNSYRCLPDVPGDIVSERYPVECYPVAVMHTKKMRYSQPVEIDSNNGAKRFCFSREIEYPENSQNNRCRPHSLSAPELRTSTNPYYSSGTMISSLLSQVVQIPALPPPQTMEYFNYFGSNSTFHYVLMAPTSAACKLHEETLAYLNQGQSYEIKIKKTGDYGELKGKLYKSVVQVGFQERRLQYIEKEQIAEWQSERPGERILEADIPLSYGVLEISNCSQNINMCEFVWDPVKENGVFLKVNCISTEFTAKKHGGEKGVPFRILVETYIHDGSWMRVHSASCQVKVFKPKGADRKHKTDREKMLRKSQVDKEKYHPQYEYTVFREVCSSELWSAPAPSCVQQVLPVSSPASSSPVSSQCSASSPVPSTPTISQTEDHQGTPATSTTEPQEFPTGPTVHLSAESSAKETALWLQQNMFGSFIKDFTHFSGSDLLKLKRQDLIDICGIAHGIRLYNLLHIRPPCPSLTLYVRLAQQQAFHAIYLETTDVSELLSKLKAINSLPTECKCEIYICGPAKIHIIVTNEVIQNMAEESVFTIECLKGHYSDQCNILLKPFSCKSPCENV